ncbi:protein NLRC5 [Melanerpes formicivorus]|uniref:protein NLRC5 n=1 Tax=Melanerpes formicivorus TaxID=211600 RepID=UPI00358FB11C
MSRAFPAKQPRRRPLPVRGSRERGCSERGCSERGRRSPGIGSGAVGEGLSELGTGSGEAGAGHRERSRRKGIVGAAPLERGRRREQPVQSCGPGAMGERRDQAAARLVPPEGSSRGESLVLGRFRCWGHRRAGSDLSLLSFTPEGRSFAAVTSSRRTTSSSGYGAEATSALEKQEEADHTTMQPPPQEAAPALGSARPQLLELLRRRPQWLLAACRRFLPAGALPAPQGSADRRDRASLLLDRLEQAGPATWKEFVQYLCMECDLPLHLEVLLISSAGEGNFSQEQEACREVRARPALPPGSPEQYRQQLIASVLQRYSNRKAAGAAAQPPAQPQPSKQAFVNLLIRQSKASHCRQRAGRAQGRGAEAAELAESLGTAMEVSDLFPTGVPPGKTRVVFLFGKAGTGKSLLVQRVCQKWAEGLLPQFLFAFLFEFRQLSLLRSKVTLRELLFELCLQPQDSPEAVFQFLLENAWHTLLIFDGLEEFAASRVVQPSPEASSAPGAPRSIWELFAALCGGKLLGGCTVLVTSRAKRLPDCLINTVDLLAEVWGFDQERAEEYISCHFHQHPLKEQAIAQLRSSPRLLSMCLLPALCHVACVCLEHLLPQQQGAVQLPQTITQFYTKMLLIFLSRQQGEGAGGKEAQLSSHRKAILGLCDLALGGLEEKKLVFPLGDVAGQVQEFACLHGLMTALEVRTPGRSPEPGCAFLHCSLQEFFAALCLMVRQSVGEADLSKRFSLKSRWAARSEAGAELQERLHIFLSGLSSPGCRRLLGLLAGQGAAGLQGKQEAVLQALRRLAASRLTGPRLLELCHCTVEAQDPQLAQDVGSLLGCSYELRNLRLTALDLAALVFVVNSSQDLAHLDFAGCLLDREGLEVLAGCRNIQHLSFRSRRIGDGFAAALAKSLGGMRSLKKLELTGGRITAQGMAALLQASAACLQLEEINLQDNRIREPEAEQLVASCCRMEKLQRVDLSNNDLSLRAVLLLAKRVLSCPRAAELCVREDSVIISFSGLSGTAPRSSAGRWEENEEPFTSARFVKLCLQCCSLSPCHAKELVTILQSCPCLSEVDLSGNRLGDEGCSCLLENLPGISISKQLNLSQNHLSVRGICSLVKALSSCQKLRELRVSLHHETAVLMFAGDRDFASPPLREEPLTSAGDQQPGEETQTPPAPKKLRLTDGCVQGRQLEELCAALQQCSSLSELDLSNNHLADQGLLQLLQLLPHLRMLRSLRLHGNQLSLTSVFLLAQSLPALEGIKAVKLSLGQRQVVELSFWGQSRLSSSRGSSSGLEQPKQDARGKSFWLRDCRLAPEEVTRLCHILAACPQLTEVELAGNSLGEQSVEALLSCLPHLCHLALLSLRTTSLSPGCIVALCSSINLCEHIRVLQVRARENAVWHLGAGKRRQKTSCRLTDCGLGAGQVAELCRVLGQHGWLAEVDLSRNQLGDEGLRCLLECLPRVPAPCSLNLSQNRISQDGVLQLINAFASPGNLSEVQASLCSKATLIIQLAGRGDPRKALSLAECSLQPEQLEELCLLLGKCSALTELRSSNNHLSLQAAERLLQALRKELGALEISLEEPWVGQESVRGLLELAVQTCGTITELRICKEETLFQLGIRFPHCLEKMESVISRLQLQEPEAKRASFYQRLWEKCAQLQELRWSHVELQEDEAELLVKALLPLPELRRFRLTSSKMLPAAVELLLTGLQSCQALEELSLASLELSSAALPQLVLALSAMPSLRRLFLNHNSIGDQGCSRLAGALGNMHCLEELE